MFPTSPDVVRALHTDRLREVDRCHLIAAAARTRPRQTFGERIGTMFRSRRRTASRAQPALK